MGRGRASASLFGHTWAAPNCAEISTSPDGGGPGRTSAKAKPVLPHCAPGEEDKVPTATVVRVASVQITKAKTDAGKLYALRGC